MARERKYEIADESEQIAAKVEKTDENGFTPTQEHFRQWIGEQVDIANRFKTQKERDAFLEGAGFGLVLRMEHQRSPENHAFKGEEAKRRESETAEKAKATATRKAERDSARAEKEKEATASRANRQAKGAAAKPAAKATGTKGKAGASKPAAKPAARRPAASTGGRKPAARRTRAGAADF